MKSSAKGPLTESIELYLAHKRSLGKQLAKVGPMLSLLDGYLSGQGVAELDKSLPRISKGSQLPGHVIRPEATTSSLEHCEDCLTGWWFTRFYRSHRCDAKFAAPVQFAGHSSSGRNKHVTSWRLRRNCPAIREPWTAVRPTE